jgi:hypothetical protein
LRRSAEPYVYDRERHGRLLGDQRIGQVHLEFTDVGQIVKGKCATKANAIANQGIIRGDLIMRGAGGL